MGAKLKPELPEIRWSEDTCCRTKKSCIMSTILQQQQKKQKKNGEPVTLSVKF